MICPDCKGSKIYQPFFGSEEACARCKGLGEVSGVSGTTITAGREENGVIRFLVTSDGTTGPEWIERLERKGFRVGGHTKSILRSPDFKPTSGVTIEIAVLKGELFEGDDRTTENVRVEAGRRGLMAPNAEVACLIREKFSDKEIKEIGLWSIIVMHEPIEDSDGDSCLLGANRYIGGHWLSTCYGGPDGRWFHDSGFAFVARER